MALLTAGTSATTSLRALQFQRGGMSVADVATFNANILNDQNNIHPIWPGAFREGQLYIPNRGVLNLIPGDYVMTDLTTGWPILVSAYAIASGPWSHS